MVWLDASIAITMTIGALWTLHVGQVLGEALRLHGESVPSGALTREADVYYVPAALLSTLALMAMGRRWPGRWFLQLIAASWFIIPGIWPGFIV